MGVSGGPDSVALLHLLQHIAPALDLELHVAHLHHGIRGADADADLEFVAQLARDAGLPFSTESADVPALAAGARLALPRQPAGCAIPSSHGLPSRLVPSPSPLGTTRMTRPRQYLCTCPAAQGLQGCAVCCCRDCANTTSCRKLRDSCQNWSSFVRFSRPPEPRSKPTAMLPVWSHALTGPTPDTTYFPQPPAPRSLALSGRDQPAHL